MREKINLSLLERLNSLASKTIPTYFSREENVLTANAKDFINGVDKVRLPKNFEEKEWEDLRKFAEVKYLGEFYERYEEKGIELNESEMSTMIIYFAMLSKNNAFAPEIFNDYQIEEFQNKALEYCEKVVENVYLDFSMFVLTGKVEYLEKFKKNASAGALALILSMLKKEKEMELIKELLVAKESLFADKTLYNNDENMKIVKTLLYTISKMNEKELPTMYSFLVKATNAKGNTNSFKKKLAKYGISENFVMELNALLAYEFNNVGDLKKQNLMINTLGELLKTKEEFTFEDKYFIDEVLSMGKFNVKMNSGTCERIGDIIRYNNLVSKIVNTRNYIYFVNKCLNKGIISVADGGFSKIKILSTENPYKERIEGIQNPTLLFYVTNCNINAAENKNEIIEILQKVEKDFNVKYKEYFYSEKLVSNYTIYRAESALSRLYSLGIYDALEDFKEKKVCLSLIERFYKDCISEQKYEFVKYLIENTKENPWKYFDKNVYLNKCIFSEYLHLFKKNAISNDHKKDLIFWLLNALVEYESDKEYYRNCFINFIRDKELVTNIFNEEEINELYHLALEIVDSFQKEEKGNTYCYSSRYHETKKELKNILDVLYMTEEEKQKLREEKEKAKKIKEEQERQREIERINNEIKKKEIELFEKYSFISTYKLSTLIEDLDWNARNSITAKKYLRDTLLNSNKITITVDNLPNLYKNIGVLVKLRLMSIEQSSDIVSKIRIVEKELVEKKRLCA